MLVRSVVALAVVVVGFVLDARADEGMVPISQIGTLGLANHGLKITTEEIFNPNGTCLLNGICRVNGCTGSFVSPDGLIITNHHCAYGAIQSASTTEKDYLANGFQAQSRADEIIAAGYTVRITESFRDISSDVLSAAGGEMNFLDRTKAIERRRKELEKQAEQANPGMRAEVAEMFSGKTYVLFLYTYLKDVRLVFAPPASIGNFGGEVDNWEWPRHTGDFSFLRAYTAPDGSSADYSPSNIPYKPKRYIHVNSQGVDEGDFVFLLGYPGRTARHKTASFLNYEQQVRLPFIAEVYAWEIAQLEAAGAKDRAVALKHASRIRSLANVEKRARGQLKGLKRANIAATRTTEETGLKQYIDADAVRKQKYGQVFSEIDQVYQEMTERAPLELGFESLISSCRSLAIAATIVDAAYERTKEDLEREPAYMDRNFDQTVQSLRLSVHDLHTPTDKQILTGLLNRLTDVPAIGALPGMKDRWASSPQSRQSQVSQLIDATRMGDQAFVENCLKLTPAQLAATNDPVLQWMLALYPQVLELRKLGKQRTGQLDKAYGLLVEVKQEYLNKSFIPDANATLRLTFGHVKGYSPEDGVFKLPITTLRGVIDKTTGQDPFITPDRVIEMYKAKDFGTFVHPKLGQVPTAILYDTDTTGGNSGSPILNARGELVGVNFDRAFEATINDFAWNANYSRSIGVDIRYCLWITGKVYKMDHLLSEMGVK